TFDGVVCTEVLEHVPDYRRAMSEVVRALKPGGWPASRPDRSHRAAVPTTPPSLRRVQHARERLPAITPPCRAPARRARDHAHRRTGDYYYYYYSYYYYYYYYYYYCARRSVGCNSQGNCVYGTRVRFTKQSRKRVTPDILELDSWLSRPNTVLR